MNSKVQEMLKLVDKFSKPVICPVTPESPNRSVARPKAFRKTRTAKR